MTTITKIPLSGSTNGRPIRTTNNVSPGTIIHTAHATDLDEVWLWAVNASTAVTRKMTVLFGGTTSPDDYIEMWFPPEAGEVLVVPGIPVTGSVLVRAFADPTDSVVLSGHVYRITP